MIIEYNILKLKIFTDLLFYCMTFSVRESAV